MDLRSLLNEDQISAVTYGAGPQLVLAGAGSGKTRVITHRIFWLIEEQGIDPRSIVAVTFTNKAAAEMQQRAENLLGRAPLECFVGTFHRFSLRLLRRYGARLGLPSGFHVLDDRDQLSLVKRALQEEGLAEGSFPPRAVLARISGAKARLVGPEPFESAAEGFFEKRVVPVYRRYEQLLRRASGVDFDDLIGLAVKLLGEDQEVRRRVQGRIAHLLVDEFQDTNHAQLRLIQELAGPGGNVTAVGDEDQGIYRWRGADLDNILLFERRFPSAVVHTLERNYRSTQNVLDASGALVAHNQNRRGKHLWTEAGAGDLIELFKARDETDEARWVIRRARELHSGGAELSAIAVLVRTNAQTRALEEELLRTQTPYCLVGGTRFYERAEIRDLTAYLRVIQDPRNGTSMRRILNQPPRGIGKTTQRLVDEECSRQDLELWDLLTLDRLDGLPSRSATALRRFRDLILELRDAVEGRSLRELLEEVLERTGYLKLYDTEDPESAARLENIGELLSAAEELGERGDSAEPLVGFLDHVALVSDLDDWETERGISVMTLHSAKGLEFPDVFIAGIEDGLLPHFNSQGRPDDIEEERRLLYVGMTRAERRLHLSSCRRRRVAGRYQDQQPSPFLSEIPTSLLEISESPSLFETARTRGVSDFFERRQRFTEEETGPGLGRGARVRHPTLGEGVVLGVEGEGEGSKLSVFFEGHGKRKLLARFAKLEVLG